MYIAIIVLGILTVSLLLTVLFLYRTLQQTKTSLQELLRESETAEKTPAISNGDIYFKADKDFNLSFIDESGARALGFEAAFLIGRPLTEMILENTDATKEFLHETFAKVAKKQTTFNTQMLIRRADGKSLLFLVRIRPILNEVLKCDGLSFLCKDISQADSLKTKLTNFQEIDPFTNILNENAMRTRLNHDFKLATRYNKELSVIVIELKDIYEFIAKGIDFETADKMLKDISSACLEFLPKDGYAGRVDKTKIVLALKGCTREDALQKAILLFNKAVTAIKLLRVDDANARMIVISYSNRKGFSDSLDAMTGRLQRHIDIALKTKEYGIISSDRRQTALMDLENIKG